jgi:hypothetical protein
MFRDFLSTPVLAALVFGAFGAFAALAANAILFTFAREAGVNTWVFVSVPSLFAALFALIVYQGAEKHVSTINQSFSRGLLVAILSWIAFSWLATWAWCRPEDYGGCFSNALVLSGVVGGGPMLLAALVAGGLMGYLILARKDRGWKLKD